MSAPQAQVQRSDFDQVMVPNSVVLVTRPQT